MMNRSGSVIRRLFITSSVIGTSVMLILLLLGEDQANIEFKKTVLLASEAIKSSLSGGQLSPAISMTSRESFIAFVPAAYLFLPYVVFLAITTHALRLKETHNWPIVILASGVCFFILDIVALETLDAYVSILLLPATIAAVALCYALEEHFELRVLVMDMILRNKNVASGIIRDTVPQSSDRDLAIGQNPGQFFSLVDEPLFNELPVGLVALDSNNLIVRANQLAAKTLDTNLDSLIGTYCGPSLLKPLNVTAGQLQASEPSAYEAQSAGGKRLWVIDQITQSELASPITRVIAFIDADILVEPQAEHENIAQYFYHDLRAPLAAIASIADSHITPSAKDVDRLRSFALRAIDISEHLLLHFRMSGNTLLSKTSINIYDLATQLEEETEARYRAKNIRIALDMSKAMPIFADYALVFRALMNLLDNAAQHSPDNATVTLGVTFLQDNCVFTVKDQGSGLKKAQPQNTNPHSFGLGLKFVRKVASQYGGNLSLANRHEGGVVATLSLKCVNQDLINSSQAHYGGTSAQAA
jgi:signal transduction histidine kinase